MKLLYFTEGQTLHDRSLREQLVRIPEVLSEIRKTKWQSQDPVMAFLELQGDAKEWVRIVQRALFLRLRKRGFKYAGLVKRERLSAEKLEAWLISLLQAKSFLEIYVIGPGFDDLHLHLRRLMKELRIQCDVCFIDIIGNDSKLTWFWSEIRKPMANHEDNIAAYH